MVSVEDFIAAGANGADWLYRDNEMYAQEIGQEVDAVQEMILKEVIALREVQQHNFADMEEVGLATYALRHAIADRKTMSPGSVAVFDPPAERMWVLNAGFATGIASWPRRALSISQDMPGLDKAKVAPTIVVGEVVNDVLHLNPDLNPEMYDCVALGVGRLLHGLYTGQYDHLAWYLGAINPRHESAKNWTLRHDVSSNVFANYSSVQEIPRIPEQ